MVNALRQRSFLRRTSLKRRNALGVSIKKFNFWEDWATPILFNYMKYLSHNRLFIWYSKNWVEETLLKGSTLSEDSVWRKHRRLWEDWLRGFRICTNMISLIGTSSLKTYSSERPIVLLQLSLTLDWLCSLRMSLMLIIDVEHQDM